MKESEQSDTVQGQSDIGWQSRSKKKKTGATETKLNFFMLRVFLVAYACRSDACSRAEKQNMVRKRMVRGKVRRRARTEKDVQCGSLARGHWLMSCKGQGVEKMCGKGKSKKKECLEAGIRIQFWGPSKRILSRIQYQFSVRVAQV
jgi:hypothetical protein